jgi:hypothetical protein
VTGVEIEKMPDDVDRLDGQTLVDAVAVEVMGWERNRVGDQGKPGSWYGYPVRDGWRAQVRVSDWRPLSSWSDFGMVVGRMAETHHWTLKTPFGPGDPAFAGLTPHGVTGWNGRPDAEGSGPSLFAAGLRAALKAARAKEAGS